MDIGENTKATKSIAPAAQSAGAVNGDSVSTVGFGEALILVGTGDVGASHTIDFKVQEQDTGGGWSDITSAAFTQLDADDDNVLKVGRIKLGTARKQNVRVVATHGGDNTGISYAIIVVGQPSAAPTDQTLAFDL